MAAEITELDAHEQPSEAMRAIWKSYAKKSHDEMRNHPDIDDPRSERQSEEFRVAGVIPAERRSSAFLQVHKEPLDITIQDVPILYHPLLPGLLVVPDLVPPPVQKSLLSLMMHRDLSVPHHQTNLHLHYDLPYRQDADSLSSSSSQHDSFFSYPPESGHIFQPKDPAVHKPLTMRQVLDRRLHWVTFGGQYDWTNRVYPGTEPPAFPPDVAGFLETLFPDTLAQAAILNFYAPGDTMMMHRDVSEETDKGLVSLSFGCEGLFMIAPNDPGKTKSAETGADEEASGEANGESPSKEKGYLLLKLRSGDAIYMTKESRFAWHGVPKVIKGSCPEWLADWPAEDGQYDEWKGWMKNKRINLNVRQMRD